MNKLCTIKTTVSTLIILFFGAMGLWCYLNWYSIVGFGKIKTFPIEYRFSIAGGFIALFVAVWFYVKNRKNNAKLLGILLDIGIVWVSLPIYILLIIQISYLF